MNLFPRVFVFRQMLGRRGSWHQRRAGRKGGWCEAGNPAALPFALAVCANSAQNSANSEHPGQTRCQSAAHRLAMGKIIIVQFRRSRLPRRLLNDGWWLETPPTPSSMVAFPKRNTPKSKPTSKSTSTSKPPHLTLITSGK
jgi:hypothetical protein